METATASPTKARTIAILLIVLAFIAGVLVGVAGDHFVLIRTGHLFPRRGFNAVQRRVMSRLDQELSLSPQQHAQIDQILTRHHQRIDQIAGAVRPQVRQELDAANREIEAVLTPEQKQKFQALKMHIGARGRRGGPHDGPPPPP